MALFTLAGAFKDTSRRQCQQLYLSLHGDGVCLTGNFPGSLPDEAVGSTSLPRSICFHSAHRSAEIRERERETNRETEEGRGTKKKHCLNETASHRWTGGKEVRNGNVEGGKD